MKIRILKPLAILSMIFSLLIVSCSNEEVEEVISEVEVEEEVEETSQELMSNLFDSARLAASTNQESDYVEEGECFVINYPYTVSDGETSMVLNSDEDLFAFLESLDYDSNAYIEVPFDVTFSDGSQQTINNYEEFEIILDDCYSDYDDNDDNDIGGGYEEECFELNYPLTAFDYQGNEVVVYSEQDLYNFEFAGFVYPISVSLIDGTQATVNSPEEFDALYNECYDVDECYDCDVQCFEIVFPFSLVSNDGTVETFDNYDELFDFLNLLTENDIYMISYPLTVEFEDGTLETVNSDDEFEALYESCE
tara:strand:+ start:842 stop:1765 length:924 start_codon:yes stop_codon:yes gene_type:complete